MAMRTRMIVVVASLMLATTACAHLPAGPVADAGQGAAGRGTLLIHATGDVSLDPDQITAFRTNGYGWAWSGLDGLFLNDDLTIVNLECPATDIVDPVSKAFTFRCDPAALPPARDAGVDVVSQANNHAYDEGPAGLVDSLDGIRGAGLVPVGAGADRAEALQPAILRIAGWTVAVVGVDQVLDPPDEVAGPAKPGTAVGHRFGLALGAVRAADTVADIVLVTIHWGIELDARPRASQVAQAHRLIDAGADAIFGSHTHTVQPVQTYRGRPIFYSLGNLVWPRLSPAMRTGSIAEVTIGPSGDITARSLPVEVVSDGHPTLVASAPTSGSVVPR